MKHNSQVISNPRVTEKASFMVAKSNCYVFDVATDATKKGVKKSIKDMYKVEPMKVNMVKISRKAVVVRGKKGFKKGGKKAYVFLKKGDKIEFV